LEWIRLLYCYPNHITEELLYTIAEEEKICNYLDIPLQHLSDPVLQRMGRKITSDEIFSLVEKIKTIIPDISLRSTFIIGFPGEKDKDFELLLNGLKYLKLNWSGFFSYSREEGTPAASMNRQVPEKIKQERLFIIKKMSEEISIDQMRKYRGRRLNVLVEEKSLDDGEWYLGRSYLQAPEVDGQIYLRLSQVDSVGKIVPVDVVGSSNFDLIGEVVNEPGQ
ncbi:MAG: radical SAM protein, partial [Bacillota bacterium]